MTTIFRRRQNAWSKLSHELTETRKILDGNRQAGTRDSDRASDESDKNTSPLVASDAFTLSKPTLTITSPVITFELETLTPPEPEPEVPLFIDPVIGWRGWVINREGVVASQFKHDDYRYPFVQPHNPPVPAMCYAPSYSKSISSWISHSSPGIKCNCGYHMGQYEYQAFTPFNMGSTIWPCAVGQAKSWGKVIEHEKGWRGEFIWPVALNLIPNPDKPLDDNWIFKAEAMKRVANRCSLLYDIPVEVMEYEEWLDIQAASKIRHRDDKENDT